MVPEAEDPVTTLVRLLDKNMTVVKDDGSIAKILVSQEHYDRELFKNHDGQVTAGLDRSEDEKIGFSGTARRRTSYARVSVWTIDKPEQGLNGRRMRDKVRAEVNRVVRENRNKPNETRYNFVGVGQGTGPHKAFHAGSVSELPPTSSSWTELTNAEYEKIWHSDDDRFSKSVNVNLQCALALFRFRVDPDEEVVKKIVLRFEGYGTAPVGNGITIKAWNYTASAWQNAQVGTGGVDETITITLTSSLTDFIDTGGYVYLLARTTNPSDGATPAALYCDYVECLVTVEGITYVDVVSFRDEDQVNVKPFIWRTEFTVKSWLFENVNTT